MENKNKELYLLYTSDECDGVTPIAVFSTKAKAEEFRDNSYMYSGGIWKIKLNPIVTHPDMLNVCGTADNVKDKIKIVYFNYEPYDKELDYFSEDLAMHSYFFEFSLKLPGYFISREELLLYIKSYAIRFIENKLKEIRGVE